MEKLPYVKITQIGSNKVEYWPYPEVQDFTLYKIPKEDIIYLTDEELKRLEEENNG